jgi:hypothetical protein
MTTPALSPAWAARGLLAAVCVAVLLAACTTTSRSIPGNETADRITASDEADPQKRARARMELASAYFGRGQTDDGA